MNKTALEKQLTDLGLHEVKDSTFVADIYDSLGLEYQSDLLWNCEITQAFWGAGVLCAPVVVEPDTTERSEALLLFGAWEGDALGDVDFEAYSVVDDIGMLTPLVRLFRKMRAEGFRDISMHEFKQDGFEVYAIQLACNLAPPFTPERIWLRSGEIVIDGDNQVARMPGHLEDLIAEDIPVETMVTVSLGEFVQ